MIDSGELIHVIDIRRREQGQDPDSGEERRGTPIAIATDVRAKVDYIGRATESPAADAEAARTRVRVKLRWRDGIEADDYIVWGDEIIDIDSVEQGEGYRVELFLFGNIRNAASGVA